MPYCKYSVPEAASKCPPHQPGEAKGKVPPHRKPVVEDFQVRQPDWTPGFAASHQPASHSVVIRSPSGCSAPGQLNQTNAHIWAQHKRHKYNWRANVPVQTEPWIELRAAAFWGQHMVISVQDYCPPQLQGQEIETAQSKPIWCWHFLSYRNKWHPSMTGLHRNQNGRILFQSSRALTPPPRG